MWAQIQPHRLGNANPRCIRPSPFQRDVGGSSSLDGGMGVGGTQGGTQDVGGPCSALHRGSFSSFLPLFHPTDPLHPMPGHPTTTSTVKPPPIDDAQPHHPASTGGLVYCHTTPNPRSTTCHTCPSPFQRDVGGSHALDGEIGERETRRGTQDVGGPSQCVTKTNHDNSRGSFSQSFFLSPSH